ncbi:MAG: hypothetical protein AB7F66_12630 [Bacteriovoracia bacterium]
MAHCSIEQVRDVADILETIKGWENIREKSRGVFYYKSVPFLHFHFKDEKRWADIKKKEGGWTLVPLPFQPSAAARKRFLAAATRHHQALARRK